MTQKEIVPFDYNSLPDEVQSEAQQISTRVKQRIQSYNKQTVENVMAIGHELLEIKPKLEHGQFLQWCELEFDLSRQQVNNFIHVVELAVKNEKHFDHSKGRTVKGINILNAIYNVADINIPVAFEIINKPIYSCDLKTRKAKRRCEVTKND